MLLPCVFGFGDYGLRLILLPNYVVTPRNPPIGEYIAAVEKTCQNLTPGEADEMRAEIKAAIKRSHPPRPNITREEQSALKELKER